MTSRTSRELPSSPVSEACDYTAIAESTLIRTGPGKMLGIFVSSASSTPTIKVWGNTSAATTVIVETFTPTSSQFYPIPARFETGCYVEIGGTVSCTVFHEARQQ